MCMRVGVCTNVYVHISTIILSILYFFIIIFLAEFHTALYINLIISFIIYTICIFYIYMCLCVCVRARVFVIVMYNYVPTKKKKLI